MASCIVGQTSLCPVITPLINTHSKEELVIYTKYIVLNHCSLLLYPAHKTASGAWKRKPVLFIVASRAGHSGALLSFSRPIQTSKPYLFTVLKPTTTLSSLLPSFAPTQTIFISTASDLWFLCWGMSIHLVKKLLGVLLGSIPFRDAV